MTVIFVCIYLGSQSTKQISCSLAMHLQRSMLQPLNLKIHHALLENALAQLLTDSNFCSAADARSDKMHEQALWAMFINKSLPPICMRTSFLKVCQVLVALLGSYTCRLKDSPAFGRGCCLLCGAGTCLTIEILKYINEVSTQRSLLPLTPLTLRRFLSHFNGICTSEC